MGLLDNTHVLRYGIGYVSAVPPGSGSTDPHAFVDFFECADYHEYFGTIYLEYNLRYQFKQAFVYCFVDWRVCIARSPSTLPWGFLHSQEKGIIASGNIRNLGDTIEGISNFICNESALSRTSDNASCAHFTHQLS